MTFSCSQGSKPEPSCLPGPGLGSTGSPPSGQGPHRSARWKDSADRTRGRKEEQRGGSWQQMGYMLLG